MAPRELLVSIAVLAGIVRSPPALACDPAAAQAEAEAAWRALDELRADDADARLETLISLATPW